MQPRWDAVDALLSDDPHGRPATVEALRVYFGPVAWVGADGFTGAAFETLDGGGDRPETRNCFTYADLVAVTMLGVHVPARAAVLLTEDADGALGRLLADIPVGVALDGVSEPLMETFPSAYDLDAAVRAITGLGPTKTSKLLARKRPHLLPVIDDVTDRAWGRPRQVWEPLRRQLREGGLADQLRELARDAALPGHVGVLRVLDVALWMRHK